MKNIYDNKILVVNDGRFWCKVFQQFLNNLGYQNLDIDSGKQAKKKLKTNPYNLLIQDLQRPRPNGFELYYWMKKKKDFFIPCQAKPGFYTKVTKCSLFSILQFLSI